MVCQQVVNCGSVFNSRSANVGGVIAYWLDYGGTVQKCFNFGKMTTNTNDHDPDLGGYGAVGGVVGIIDQPISGGTTNVLSCRNYGQIWYDSNAAGANDCAGIIGKIEMKKPTDIMTLNIITASIAVQSRQRRRQSAFWHGSARTTRGTLIMLR